MSSAAPTVVWDESATSASGAGTLPSIAAANGAQPGDLLILKQYGRRSGGTSLNEPTYADDNSDVALDLDQSRYSGIPTGNGGGVIWSRVLTTADFVGGNPASGLRKYAFDTAGWNTDTRASIEIAHHANGWDTTSARLVGLITSTDINANNANGTALLLYAGGALRACYATGLIAYAATGQAGAQITWSGQSARDPYNDDSSQAASPSLAGHAAIGPFSMTFASGSTTVTCASADADWVGLILGASPGANKTVVSVTPGVSFVISGAATATGTSNYSFLAPHNGTGNTHAQADFQEYAAGQTGVSMAVSLGCANTSHSFIATLYQVLPDVDFNGAHMDAVADIVAAAHIEGPVYSKLDAVATFTGKASVTVGSVVAPAPAIKWLEAGATGSATLPASATITVPKAGDVAVIVQAGAYGGGASVLHAPTYKDGPLAGLDAGYQLLFIGDQFVIGGGRIVWWAKKLTSADFSGLNLIRVVTNSSPFSGASRPLLIIARHPYGFDFENDYIGGTPTGNYGIQWETATQPNNTFNDYSLGIGGVPLLAIAVGCVPSGSADNNAWDDVATFTLPYFDHGSGGTDTTDSTTHHYDTGNNIVRGDVNVYASDASPYASSFAWSGGNGSGVHIFGTLLLGGNLTVPWRVNFDGVGTLQGQTGLAGATQEGKLDAIGWVFGVPLITTGPGPVVSTSEVTMDAVATFVGKAKVTRHVRAYMNAVADMKAYKRHPHPGPPHVILPSTETILDGLLPIRADRFRFVVLDAHGVEAGVLDVSEDQPANLRFDTTNTIARRLSGVTIRRKDLSNIDVDHERIAVKMVLQNDDVFDLGVLMFGQTNQTLGSTANVLTPELFDEVVEIDQALEQTFSFATGFSVYGAITLLLADFPATNVLIDVPDTEFGAPGSTFPVGSSRYDALKQCAVLLGTFPPYFDNHRRFRFKRSQVPTDTTMNHAYEAGRRLFDDTVRFTESSYKVPNRWLVTNDDPQNPIVGQYDLPDDSPNSAANKGRLVVAPLHTVSGILSVEAANQQAYIDRLTDRTSSRSVSFQATADPRHDGYDTMTVLGAPFMETAWELLLTSGGAHTHEGTTLWPVA